MAVLSALAFLFFVEPPSGVSFGALLSDRPVLSAPGHGKIVAIESGSLELRAALPRAAHAWLHYQPDAGEVRRYYLGRREGEFTWRWRVEPATGGSLYLAAGAIPEIVDFSEPLRVVSRSYQALQQVVAPHAQVRLEVNLPAFELAAYRGNELLRRFRIGIGLKSWPVPAGMRTAREIVWNPRWLPPDSPWVTPGLVRRLQARGEVLGRMKIPLGGEILIHGTNRRGDLGRAVSHGCLRMFDPDLRALARLLMSEMGIEGDAAKIRRAETRPRFSYGLALPQPVLVVIRYEPVEVRGGKVVVHNDVYGWSPVTPARIEEARSLAGPGAEVGTASRRHAFPKN